MNPNLNPDLNYIPKGSEEEEHYWIKISQMVHTVNLKEKSYPT